MPLTIPNLLTLFRIALVPMMVVAFCLPYPGMNLLAASLFVAGALTDWLDGWIARRWGMTSAFGAFLDPVADKIAVVVALFLIVQADPTPLMAVVAAIIVGREVTISALREWMAAIGERMAVGVAAIGKIKTIVQMVAISVLLFQHPKFPLLALPLYETGRWLLVGAAVLTLWSAAQYLKAAWPLIRDRQ
ncbi:MAG: CDP-diacylglycerol--glycerol-3-phosphate 3-phosphatidyltransferase [Pseudomonadota bacterium]|jgi:CDP-diacylglycerol--glycerol-3-phosphate 3-phosphatidyltransferase